MPIRWGSDRDLERLALTRPHPPRVHPVCTPSVIGEDFEVFLRREDGRAVATAVAFVSHGFCGVYAVATDAHARGRGYGEALRWAATLFRPDLPATLQASDMGLPIYQRMGYEVFGDFTVWEGSRGGVPAQFGDQATFRRSGGAGRARRSRSTGRRSGCRSAAIGRSVMWMPFRAATPMMTTLALAPTRVALPPRSAPRASAHHSAPSVAQGRVGGDQRVHDRGHRGDERDVVHDRRGHRRADQHHHQGGHDGGAGQVGDPGGQRLQGADPDQRPDQDEQAHEEQQGLPLDLVEQLPDPQRGQQDQHPGAEQGHHRGGQPGLALEQEPDRRSRPGPPRRRPASAGR